MGPNELRWLVNCTRSPEGVWTRPFYLPRAGNRLVAVLLGTYLGLHTAACPGGALGAGGELGLVPGPFPY